MLPFPNTRGLYVAFLKSEDGYDNFSGGSQALQ